MGSMYCALANVPVLGVRTGTMRINLPSTGSIQGGHRVADVNWAERAKVSIRSQIGQAIARG